MFCSIGYNKTTQYYCCSEHVLKNGKCKGKLYTFCLPYINIFIQKPIHINQPANLSDIGSSRIDDPKLTRKTINVIGYEQRY